MDVTKIYRPIVTFPYPLKDLILRTTGLNNYVNPAMHPDRIVRRSIDVVSDSTNDSVLTLSDLGMEPFEMEPTAFDYLYRYRRGGHFKFVDGYYSSNDKSTMEEHAPKYI